MTATPYPNQITSIQNGQPVDAGTTNAPIDQLAARTDSLSQRVDEAQLGSAVYDYNVPIDPLAQEGMAVYLGDDGVYHPGLASTVTAANSSSLSVARTAYIAGVVAHKFTTTLGNVTLQGKQIISGTALRALMVEGTITTGPVFLSGTPAKPGYLTSYQPPIGIPVGTVSGPDAEGDYTLLVSPTARNVLENHIHYRVRLSTSIAGSSGQSGWLDASNSYWATQGITPPAGARYGYLLVNDQTLSEIWPPIPLDGVYVESSGTGLNAFSPPSANVVVNYDTVWWITPVINPSDSTWLDLYFVKMLSKTSSALVTSLKAADGSVTITNTAGQAATTGDLQIKVNYPTTVSSDATPGSLAVKSITGTSVNRGLMVEGVKSLSPNLVITGGTALSDDGTFLGGRVALSLNDEQVNREGHLNLLKLDNVEVLVFEDIPYLSMGPSRPSSIRGRLRVPSAGAFGTSPTLTLTFWLYAPATGVLPTLTLTGRTLTPPPAPGAQVALPGVDVGLPALNLATYGSVTGNSYIAVVTDPITVLPGDLLFFTLARAGSDGYTSDLGILDINWVLDVGSGGSSSSGGPDTGNVNVSIG